MQNARTVRNSLSEACVRLARTDAVPNETTRNSSAPLPDAIPDQTNTVHKISLGFTPPLPSVEPPRARYANQLATSLVTGAFMCFPVPWRWIRQVQAAAPGFAGPTGVVEETCEHSGQTRKVRKRLATPRVYHRAAFLMPQHLLVDTANVLAALQRPSDCGNPAYWAVCRSPVEAVALGMAERNLQKISQCGLRPKWVFTCPGDGLQVTMPMCGQKGCPTCNIVDTRRQTARFGWHLRYSLAKRRDVAWCVLSFEQRDEDGLEFLLDGLARAWTQFAGKAKAFKRVVHRYVGGVHIELVRRYWPDRSTSYAWRVHMHAALVFKNKSQRIPRYRSREHALIALKSGWNYAVQACTGRSGAAPDWDFVPTGQNPQKAAVRMLKYAFGGFAGPRWRESKQPQWANGDTSLPLRDWSAERFAEFLLAAAKGKCNRLRASLQWRKRGHGRLPLRLFMRHRKNSKTPKGRKSGMPFAEYLKAVEDLSAGRRHVPREREILESLPAVYADLCLNEVPEASRLLRLLNKCDPDGSRLHDDLDAHSGVVDATLGASPCSDRSPRVGLSKLGAGCSGDELDDDSGHGSGLGSGWQPGSVEAIPLSSIAEAGNSISSSR